MRSFNMVVLASQVSADTMTAVQKTGFTGCKSPDWKCIAEKSVSVPTPGKGQALLEVLGSSVNPVDCDLVEAPVIGRGTIGMDGSGKVVTVGSGCDLVVGDEVFGSFKGAYAQYALADCAGLAKKGQFSHAEAGTLPVVAGTAVQCLRSLGLPDLAKTNSNLTVVVTSGQGGTGHMGVQIAKAMGAKRVITACTGEGIAFCKELGADLVVDYHEQDLFAALPDNSVDLVFDNYGSKGNADKAMHAIRSGGAFLVLQGGEAGKISDHPKEGVKQIAFGLCDAGREELTYAAGLIDTGAVKSHIFASYGLHEVPQAWAALRGHGVLGKVSIDPSNITNSAVIV